jgi:hypothetical protein
MKISFSINQYDSDGDIFDEGVYLYLGDTVIIKVKNVAEVEEMSKQLETVASEIRENYPIEERTEE